ncbi:MAG: putative 2-deoxycytidine 5-triphosphate deaminase, dCTP deaminase [candidate division Kazan bacterium GW2011_GWA1_50_15]|uniref:Deoxycytidine triphosphate deaminase n=2 Tax=Bacteria division Kazan-3B-28 TaxID=1798534 RepID=A0A0G1ZGZ1_UNCK3|nr:MAG: putative 2-deoxycytidine 5-triphosphate deaminase, dCTP deaminase [candidate division Kazan bacterium GW2011_GWA1_50_15]KKW25813.1 MAG: hypothetical protein VE99_C0001G0452 [candidate division Kazan bacterium GW2011_GWC1_52_13]KKW27172.1 MAG: hypothetical protein VF00_C0001G0107 [candidate division Kazan bacterium GW2011_GWB1_52_7]HCR42462.1 hypothetical protein [Patescibacteria group bacterium]
MRNGAPIGAVLVDWQMEEMVREGRITGGIRRKDDIQPCSFDLRVGNKMWETAGILDLGDGFKTKDFMNYAYNAYDEKALMHGYILTRGAYFVQLDINLKLGADEWGFVNPKSSSGRIDLHCIALAEGSTSFNTIPHGYHGRVSSLVIPQSIIVALYKSVALVQLRIFRGERAFLSNCELRRLHASHSLIDNSDIQPVIEDDHFLIRANLRDNPSNLVVTGTRRPLKLKAKRSVDPRIYFRVKELDSQGALWLEPGEFALIGSIEKIRIPHHVCAEMVPFSDRQGEFRSHYAGFFDRGFGYGRNGEAPGNTVVCEVRNQASVPIRIAHGQLIARFRFEYLQYEPDLVYGEGGQVSHYARQSSGIALAKFFVPWTAPSAPAEL